MSAPTAHRAKRDEGSADPTAGWSPTTKQLIAIIAGIFTVATGSAVGITGARNSASAPQPVIDSVARARITRVEAATDSQRQGLRSANVGLGYLICRDGGKSEVECSRDAWRGIVLPTTEVPRP
jgi:hypothetical protein